MPTEVSKILLQNENQISIGIIMERNNNNICSIVIAFQLFDYYLSIDTRNNSRHTTIYED